MRDADNLAEKRAVLAGFGSRTIGGCKGSRRPSVNTMRLATEQKATHNGLVHQCELDLAMMAVGAASEQMGAREREVSEGIDRGLGPH